MLQSSSQAQPSSQTPSVWLQAQQVTTAPVLSWQKSQVAA